VTKLVFVALGWLGLVGCGGAAQGREGRAAKP